MLSLEKQVSYSAEVGEGHCRQKTEQRGPKGSLRGVQGCHLVKGSTGEAGKGDWGQTMKGSECQPKLNSEDNGTPSKVSKRRGTIRNGHG